jgi:steroid 5-alpha reductase family enzyme
MMSFPIWAQWAAIAGVQVAVWVPSSALQTERFYDLTGAATYIGVTLLSLKAHGSESWRHLAIAACELIWAGRLGVFLFSRVLSHEDVRFAKVKTRPMTFLIYWLVQALWIATVNLPVALSLAYGNDASTTLSITDVVGLALFAGGFLLEAVADSQKSQFKANPSNKGRFIRHGLWSFVRYPNYLGEILLQTGIAVFASGSGLEGVTRFLPFIGPAFVSWLLVRVSGIPLLEKIGEKRWGNDADWKRYTATTSKLIPGLY